MRQNWFVVTALVKGKILYRKTVFGRRIVKSFEITYDESQRAIYDPVAAHVAKSFN